MSKNTNCLTGLECPRCGNADRLYIKVFANAEVTDDGVQDLSDIEWDKDSGCTCPDCDFDGTIAAFMGEGEAQGDTGTRSLADLGNILGQLDCHGHDRAFSAAAGMYCYLMTHHGGQWSENYRRLSVLGRHYRPGHGSHPDHPDRLDMAARAVYDCAKARNL